MSILSVIPEKGEQDFFVEMWLSALCVKIMLALLEAGNAREYLKDRYALGIYTKHAEFLPIDSAQVSSTPISLSLNLALLSSLHFCLFVGHFTFHPFQSRDCLTGSQAEA